MEDRLKGVRAVEAESGENSRLFMRPEEKTGAVGSG